MQDTHCEDVPEIVSQHKVLLREADDVLELAAKGDLSNIAEVHRVLTSFKSHLKEHIKFENKVFYDKLLNDMWADGEDSTGVEKFISDMRRIADVVFAFLDKYSTVEQLSNDRQRFSKDFGRIVGILIMRIEMEESSSYFADCLDI